MLPEQTSILIVGAGPTGLSAAISLFNQGCKDILIVDAVERSPDTSRAMAIHAATLEVVTMPAIISGFSLKLLQ
jgi:2-polyprenyl-6-methoxyphenol hydroxylase-like FAD-dependent oxidoreductase